MLWQGSPDWRVLARTAFHTRLVGGYFAVLVGVAAIQAARSGSVTGIVITSAMGLLVVAILSLLAWGTARTTIYTLTNRRIVLRIGMALPKCVNLPLSMVGAVGLRQNADGSGDLPIQLTGRQQLGYLVLWPHARPWHVNEPQPMLRAVPDVAGIAALIGRACLAAHPEGSVAAVAAPAPAAAEPALAGLAFEKVATA
jgi:hypothetical protein